jgi:hypothetical protein
MAVAGDSHGGDPGVQERLLVRPPLTLQLVTTPAAPLLVTLRRGQPYAPCAAAADLTAST